MLRKIFIAAAIFFTCVTNVFAAVEIPVNRCGEDVFWDFENGTLIISGEGEMANYLIEDKDSEHYGWFYGTPWNDLKPSVTKIIIIDGVTSVGSHAFTDMDNLKTVEISDSVNFIGSQAFVNCKNLETVNLPGSVKFGKGVFENCPRLSNMQISSGGKNLVASKNLNAHEYTRWAKPINSYLYVDGENLIRVENINGRLVVEKYSPEFELVDSRSVDFEFEIWGGFYAGRDANFVIVGKSNDAESESAEVIRIAKFDKNWNYLSDAKIYGANTKNPFAAASLRCAESGGKLYIRTGHQMFRSSDGLNHQSNMTSTLDESAMKFSDVSYLVEHNATGYVSHSFNQHILIDSDKNILLFDHGDAFPRAALLNRYKNAAAGGKFRGPTENIELVKFAGKVGDNATGAAIGGIAETDSGYVSVYAYDGVGGSPDDFWNVINLRSLYAAFTSKNNFSGGGTKTVKIPLSDENFSAGVPILVPVSKSGGYIFCNELAFNGRHFETGGKIFIARYGSGGVEATSSVEGRLSDCQPIIYNGKIVWYVTENTAPEFYIFDGSSLIRK